MSAASLTTELPEPLARHSLRAAPGSVANVHFSSASDDWATPQDFFDAQDKIHGFTLDVCADSRNAKCGLYFTKRIDGLSRPWSPHRCWMNPPYGREIGKWMQKAYEESQRGALVVCLVPSRTDTAWWHDYAAKGDVTFIRGRLKFGGHTNSAPFPSALVVLKPQNAELRDRSGNGTPTTPNPTESMKHSETKPLRAVPLQRLVMALFVMAALYLSAAWPVFQWRNPLSNEMSFFRNFADVVTWKKLPEYQP